MPRKDRRQYYRDYYQANKDRMDEHHRRYVAGHADKIAEDARARAKITRMGKRLEKIETMLTKLTVEKQSIVETLEAAGYGPG